MKIQPSNNLTFRAGMTKAMKNEIVSSDVAKISKYLERQGVQNDFKNNKVIAWCVLKVFELMKPLKMGLPRGVFVEDFKKLNISENHPAMVNLVPTKLYKEEDFIVPEMVIFFNETYKSCVKPEESYWKNLDEEADINFYCSNSPTNFFLGSFLHEFSHVVHEKKLIEKLGGNNLVALLKNQLSLIESVKFAEKYGNHLRPICEYATTNFLEAVACDLTKRFVDEMDKKTLTIKKDFFKKTPYREPSLFSRIFKIQNPSDLEIILRNFWNGKV